jgi:hypothetical protein
MLSNQQTKREEGHPTQSSSVIVEKTHEITDLLADRII